MKFVSTICVALIATFAVGSLTAPAQAGDECVARIQHVLSISALPVKPGPIDGDLGPGTIASAEEFLKYNTDLSLESLNEANKETWCETLDPPPMFTVGTWTAGLGSACAQIEVREVNVPIAFVVGKCASGQMLEVSRFSEGDEIELSLVDRTITTQTEYAEGCVELRQLPGLNSKSIQCLWVRNGDTHGRVTFRLED